MALRFDRSDFPKAEVTPQGYLRAHAYATRTGVFPYRMADGSIKKEYRSAAEVFKPESMKTLAGIAMTNLHPKEALLNPENTKKHMIGFTGDNVEVCDGKFLSTTVTVTDKDGIDAIKSGQQELSCGYSCDLVPEPGISPDGEPYDFVQRNIVYNHLASVPKGRMGADSRIHLDADDGEMVNSKENSQMPKLKIGDKEYDASPELHAAHEAMMGEHKKKMDEMQAKMDDYMKQSNSKQAKPAVEGEQEAGKQDLPEMQKKMDAMQARLDAAIDELKKGAPRTDTTALDVAVRERMSLVETARKIVPESVKLDAMSNEDVMKEVIKADNKDVSLEGKSTDYVKARYDFVAERLGSAAQARTDLGKAIVSTRADSATPDADKARQKMIEDAKAGSKTKLGIHI